MTIIIDGKACATKILLKLADEISSLEKKPKLAVILVGENAASQVYVNYKQKRASAVGIETLLITLPADISEDALLEHIDVLNEDVSINAILVQLPLPEHIDTTKVISRINPEKDVDGFNPLNVGLAATSNDAICYPCTPLGIIKLLNEYKINIEGKHVVIVGRSNIVGKPLAQMMLKRNATVTVCHSKTENLIAFTKQADILISAVGSASLIKGNMIKPNAIVIDVGITRLENGKIAGDVAFDEALNIAGAITPVPGGVGPMTIATLLENTYRLYRMQNCIY